MSTPAAMPALPAADSAAGAVADVVSPSAAPVVVAALGGGGGGGGDGVAVAAAGGLGADDGLQLVQAPAAATAAAAEEEEDPEGDGCLYPPHDVRVDWLRQKVCVALDMPRNIFNTALKTESGAKCFQEFLDGSAPCLLFYSDIVVTLVQTMIDLPPPKKIEEEEHKPIVVQEEQEKSLDPIVVEEKKSTKKTGKKDQNNKKGDKEQQQEQQEQEQQKQQQQQQGEGEKKNTTAATAEEGGGNNDKAVEMMMVERKDPVLCVSTGYLSEHALSVTIVYFLKMMMSTGSSMDIITMDNNMDSHVEYGVLPSGPSLSCLEQLMLQLFVPLLAREQGMRGESRFWVTEEQHMMEHIGHELLTNMQRFTAQVSNAKQRLDGDLQLIIPTIPAESMDKTEVDYELILQLEGTLSDWVPALGTAIHRESTKVPLGKSPLAETEFWRDRSSSLSSLYEQLHSVKAKRMLSVLEAGSSNSNLLGTFKAQVSELSKMFLEAKDNVKFLTTLERHFKTICDGKLPRALETISPMMSALRLVWIISRYYSDDACMGSLMERIAYQIAERVSQETDFRNLVKRPAAEATRLISTSKSVLDSWSDLYLQVREKIEVSGRDPRWEFDRKKLFERTTYMSTICVDLMHIVEVVNDFLYFLGPDLKTVTGDVQGIDNVIHKVHAMVAPVENLPFDAFDKSHAALWQAVVYQFDQDKGKIEDLTKAFIDTSFKKLRSAEGGSRDWMAHHIFFSTPAQKH